MKKESKPILAVSNLCVERGSTTILRDVAWQVDRGQHWAILGPNGSGKTSLLKLLTGYMSPTKGTIAVLGRIYGQTDWRELRARIGIVSSSLQMSIPAAETALETVISGKYAQLDLWAKISRKDLKEGAAFLCQVGLSELGQREWVYLSQGERQRVLIARALMAKPEILILDEPCAGLDPVAREHFLGFVERLARRRSSPCLVLVTHHVEEITPAFTHALLLRTGKVITSGQREKALTSAQLSKTFGASVKLIQQHGKLRLLLPPSLHSSPTL
ncbi:MAG: ABC transporter ATP-binding protein [Nibricoccus sp.]